MALRFCDRFRRKRRGNGGNSSWVAAADFIPPVHRLAAAFILLAIASAAQSPGPVLQPKASPTQRVTTVPMTTITVAAGGSKHIEILFRVTPGYHINSHTPSSELLVATVLKVNPPTNVEIAKVTYPAGEDRSFPFAPGETLNVYTGDFIVSALVHPARNTPPGKFRVRGALEYQACDDRACYPPGKLPVAFDVRVTRAAKSRHRRNPAQSPDVHR